MPRSSVLATQEPVLKLQAEIHQTELRLQRMKADLALALEKHREQIRKSLESKDLVEQGMAKSIAVFWDVLPPSAG